MNLILEHILIAIVALATSILTFFSGFGLGTLLSPAFALFFPIEIAVALTAIVHFLNNIFKGSLMFRHINKTVFLSFAPFSFVGAFAGAYILSISILPEPILNYEINQTSIFITWPDLMVGFAIILFAFLEMTPEFLSKILKGRSLWIGGLLSGFFGGLSGHQGALRSMFLIKAQLSKEEFIATGVSIALIIDITRISIYTHKFGTIHIQENIPILITAISSALLGVIIGRKLLKKITLNLIHKIVAWMLLLIGLGIASGLV